MVALGAEKAQQGLGFSDLFLNDTVLERRENVS